MLRRAGQGSGHACKWGSQNQTQDPLSVVKLVILILMTAGKVQDSEIRQGGKKAFRLHCRIPEPRIVICFSLLLAGEETEA